MAQTRNVKTLCVSIECPPEQVYSFVSEPQNLPQWAASFARSVRREGNTWLIETPDGPVAIQFVERNPFGVLDHSVRLASGEELMNPMRVVPNGEASELMFTLLQPPGMSEQQFEEDAGKIVSDLRTLKDILEKRSCPMPGTLQEFLVSATQKAAADLETAFLRLPEEQRGWSPMGKARTAVDMVAECAILNGTTVDMIKSRTFPADFEPVAFKRAKADVSQDWNALQSLLQENTARVTEAIRAVADDDLGIEIAMPWGSHSLAQLIAYPYWNMSYHEGQINYLASMLGCLE